MISKLDIFKLYEHYGSIKAILDYLGIDIEYLELKGKMVESRIVINFYGDTTIFITPNLDEQYENFILAHELGHYILHYDNDTSFSFLRNVYKTKIEKEANEFACDILLSDINIKQVENIDFIRKEKGIPDKIWYTYCEETLAKKSVN